MNEASIYAAIDANVEQGELQNAAAELVRYLEQNGQYHELFEALKMQLRLRMGLPAAQAEFEEKLDDDRERELEKGLLDACRQVGGLLMREGKVREGWMYLRPIGDREEAAAIMASVEPNDDNTDELLEVLIHEGVDIGRGYELALTRLGTCNSITLFESALASRPRGDQQTAASLLVRHVHAELLENVRRDVEQREGQPPAEESLEAICESRPEMLRDGTYHLDTSHIASTVRFARVLDDEDELSLAYDIASYGKRLHPQYQYPGEEPFLDLYPASTAFMGALLGRHVDAGLRYFAKKADSVDGNQFGTVAIEVYIDLLSRCGRHADAMQAYHQRLPAGSRLVGIAPTLLQLSQRMGEFESMRQICQQRDDLLGYAAAALRTQDEQ